MIPVAIWYEYHTSVSAVHFKMIELRIPKYLFYVNMAGFPKASHIISNWFNKTDNRILDLR